MPVLTYLHKDDKNCFSSRIIISFCTISPKTKLLLFMKGKNRYRSASLTAEAALVFPVFFFAIYMLWQLFLFLLFQLQVTQTMTETAMQYAHLGYTQRKSEEQNVDISWLYQPILWNALPESDRVENLWVLCVPQTDGELEITVGYQFVCEAVFFAKTCLPVQQSFRFYPYLGIAKEDLFVTEETKDVVYMTEYGTVYHESRACSYLNAVVKAVPAAQVEQERNNSGRRYSLCERCDDKEATQTVYLSAGGTKYHLVIDCSALKRTVIEKTREEVNGIPACHKCGTKEDGG